MVQIRNNLDYEIILVLLKGETHLRELARIIKKSHVTILRKLIRLRKDNIVDYKQEGKNKVYFIKNNIVSKQFIYQSENYKLIKLIGKYPEMEVIIEGILKEIKEDIIILFGSYAKFIAKEDSDIDVYVETKDSKLRERLREVNLKINAKIGTFDLSSSLIKEIIKNHIVLRGLEKYYEKIRIFE